jgi:hypothetical protein
MIDMFPFPRITGETPEKQIAELISYLIQFKETLEFALGNISMENLSPDLVNKINNLGANIEQSNLSKEDEFAQIAKHTSQFTVNLETGNLDYEIK